jgi:hypothetical protein
MGYMKQANQLTSLLSCLIIASIALSGCGGTPTPLPPVVVQPNPISGINSNSSSYINLLINSVKFTGRVSNLGNTGNLQLIVVVSDDSGHADALFCPYGGVIQVHQGDKINPCKAGLAYPEEVLQGNLYLVMIATDVKQNAAFTDASINALGSALSVGLQKLVKVVATAKKIDPEDPRVVVGSLVLEKLLDYAGNKVQEYFKENYIIGTQSFIIPSKSNWNNSQPIDAPSANGQVNFTFVVQKSSTSQGKVVEALPIKPSVVNSSTPKVSVESNETTKTPSSSDPEQFVRSYFYSLTHDRDYKHSWSLLTDGFKEKNVPGGYSDYVKFWDKIDSVDLNSIDFYEHTSTSAKCRVSITFHANDTQETDDVRYHLIFDSSHNTWMFESP